VAGWGVGGGVRSRRWPATRLLHPATQPPMQRRLIVSARVCVVHVERGPSVAKEKCVSLFLVFSSYLGQPAHPAEQAGRGADALAHKDGLRSTVDAAWMDR